MKMIKNKPRKFGTAKRQKGRKAMRGQINELEILNTKLQAKVEQQVGETSCIETHIEMLMDAKELKRIGADKLPQRDLHHRVMRILAAYGKLQQRIEQLEGGLRDVINFTPNDTDFDRKPTRDECLAEIKSFAEQVLQKSEAKDGEEKADSKTAD